MSSKSSSGSNPVPPSAATKPPAFAATSEMLTSAELDALRRAGKEMTAKIQKILADRKAQGEGLAQGGADAGSSRPPGPPRR
jgi:hypothetical protein